MLSSDLQSSFNAVSWGWHSKHPRRTTIWNRFLKCLPRSDFLGNLIPHNGSNPSSLPPSRLTGSNWIILKPPRQRLSDLVIYHNHLGKIIKSIFPVYPRHTEPGPRINIIRNIYIYIYCQVPFSSYFNLGTGFGKLHGLGIRYVHSWLQDVTTGRKMLPVSSGTGEKQQGILILKFQLHLYV